VLNLGVVAIAWKYAWFLRLMRPDGLFVADLAGFEVRLGGVAHQTSGDEQSDLCNYLHIPGGADIQLARVRYRMIGFRP